MAAEIFFLYLREFLISKYIAGAFPSSFGVETGKPVGIELLCAGGVPWLDVRCTIGTAPLEVTIARARAC